MLWAAGGLAGAGLHAELMSSSQQALSATSFHLCPYTCAVAGTRSKRLTRAKWAAWLVCSVLPKTRHRGIPFLMWAAGSPWAGIAQ